MQVLCVLALLASPALGRVDYSGYQVLRVQVTSEQQADTLTRLEEENLFDFWTEVRLGKHVDIMAAPHTVLSLETWLGEAGLVFSVMIPDVSPLLELERRSVGNTTAQLSHSMDWTSYHPLDEMYGWFDYLETTHDFIETESIGQSYEGQEMIVLKVCRGGCGNKPAMWIDSGIHAREWISPATGTWMLHELVENDAAHPDLTEKLDWYFLPSHNPDGYRKSRNDDRMWRKTTTHYSGDSCQGTDANRNWDFHWSETGASGDSCSQTYYGPEPFSEVETRNVRDFVSAHKDQIKFYQTLHSYSQLILMPWGYTTSHAPGYDAMFDLGNRGNDALFAVHGKFYEVGCIPCVLYTAAGTSLDWALGVAGIPYVYSIELRDTGSYGFLLPPEQIIPTAEETWAWHEVAAKQIIDEFGA
jgi:carboxypeptidase A1